MNILILMKLNDQWIPPRKEIFLKSLRSHPEEKSDLGTPDPTPKKNVVKERQILINLDRSHPEEKFGQGATGSHPEENYGWEKRGRAKGLS